jgi:hypothetical protein
MPGQNMGYFRKITALVQPSKGTVSFAEAEQALHWQRLQEDLGEFVYEEDGFSYPFKEHAGKLPWSEIERIVAYKLDQMTTDEICLDISTNGWKITYSESVPGWYQFVAKLKQAFPAIPDNWDGQIMQPPFATNYTVLYEREERRMPKDAEGE